MGFDGLVPPLQGFREVVAGQFVSIKIARGMRRDGSQSGCLTILLILLRRDAVELAVVVAGSLHTCITHLVKTLEHLGVILGIGLCIAKNIADAVELQVHLLGLRPVPPCGMLSGPFRASTLCIGLLERQQTDAENEE